MIACRRPASSTSLRGRRPGGPAHTLTRPSALPMCHANCLLWPKFLWMSLMMFRISSLKMAISMLRAGPLSFDMPSMRTCFVMRSELGPAITLKTISASRMSSSIDWSQVFRMGFLQARLNSSISMFSLPSASTSSKSRSIFRRCVSFAVLFCDSRTKSSWAATLKVSCMKTPRTTLTTAKPTEHLCKTKAIAHHSLTFSMSVRLMGP
mmetsp:Transcript_78799/g.244594  ORF Transcript_78799/g.244594 Transcript_78799/m.244594 type:complete len:208 (-) Transcript_78799:157-780(-)